MDWTRGEVLTFYGLIIGSIVAIAVILMARSRVWRFTLFSAVAIIVGASVWVLHFGGQNPIEGWTRPETLSLVGILLAAIGGIATILMLPSRRWRIGLYSSLVFVFIVVAMTLSLKMPAPAQGKTLSYYEMGKSLMAEGKFFEAMQAFGEAFEKEFDRGTSRHIIDDAYYSAGVCGLRLSSPDCEAALRMFGNIQPDIDGLGQKLLDESKKCGCSNMQNLTPLNHLVPSSQ